MFIAKWKFCAFINISITYTDYVKTYEQNMNKIAVRTWKNVPAKFQFPMRWSRNVDKFQMSWWRQIFWSDDKCQVNTWSLYKERHMRQSIQEWIK